MPGFFHNHYILQYLIEAALPIILTLIVFKFSWKKTEKETKHDSDFMFYELSNLDSYFFRIDIPPVTTLTWFKGNYKRAEQILSHRMEKIIQVNPWICGKIVKKQNKYYLCYSKKDNEINMEKHLKRIDPINSPISRATDIEKLSEKLRKFTLKNGFNESLFRAVIVPCKKHPERNFALMVQMSHVAGDGATYYQLQRMLCSKDEREIFKLNPERIKTSKEQQIAVLGKQEEAYYYSCIAWSLRYMIGLVLAKMSQPTKYHYAYIDPLKMEKAKAVALRDSELPFVSTNDVVTSWFMSATNYPTGIMFVNWRNRLENHFEDNAGNYENVIFYQKEDFKSPALIRKSLLAYRRIVTKNMPGFFTTLTQREAGVTNWATFSNENEIEGCEEDLHIPLSASSHWSTSVSWLVIFRAGKERLGVCHFQTSDVNHLENAPFLMDEPLK